ncbi:MAG TPA: hypothetical protein PKZ99_09885 [Azospirillaceae bacterium]|nr:hypothetical protein [Azospirillaceae bacterium]
MAGLILTDRERIDLMLPGMIFRRIIAALIREGEKDGVEADKHPLMPALRLFDLAAAQAVDGLPADKVEKLTRRCWRVAGRAVKPLEERPLATAMVAATAMLRQALDEGVLETDPEGPFMRAFTIVAATSDQDPRDADVLATVRRSGEKAGRRMLEQLRQEGALLAPKAA